MARSRVGRALGAVLAGAAVVGAVTVGGLSGARLTSARLTSARPPARAPLPLAGKVIGIDPGHNGRNWADPAFINHRIWNGRQREACDTTGTATNGGYPEPRFTFNVAMYLAADLRAAGAHVVLTRTTNRGVGTCVNARAFL